MWQALHDDESGNGSIQDGARVAIFHGKPRPWDIGWQGSFAGEAEILSNFAGMNIV